MPLTGPMHAIPGELLTSTELQEDVDYNPKWKVPNSRFDITDRRVMLEYGELWLVLASWHDWPDGEPEHWFDAEVTRRSPALLFHLPTCKIHKFDDIEDVGWLWRPNEAISPG